MILSVGYHCARRTLAPGLAASMLVLVLATTGAMAQAPDAGASTRAADTKLAAGEVPAGMPTVDQPATAGEAPRTVTPGKAQTSWDTFMYEGPGYHYAVIDEVAQGHLLIVTGCTNGWCQVLFGGRRGYLLAEVLTTDHPAKPAPGFLPNPATAIVPNPPGPCIEAMQTEGNGGKNPTRYCQKASQ